MADLSIEDYKQIVDEPSVEMLDDTFVEPILKAPLNLFPESVAAALIKKGPNYHHIRFSKFMNQKRLQEVRELALNAEFIADNKEYVESGDLPHLALRYNETPLLNELMQAGYLYPKRRFIAAIEAGELSIIRGIIDENLYSRNEVEVPFWLMLEMNMSEQARSLYVKEPEKLGMIFREHSLDSRPSIETFLTSPMTCKQMLKCALESSEDIIACRLLHQCPEAIDYECVSVAVGNYCIEFLKIVWTGNLVAPHEKMTHRASTSVIWDYLSSNIEDKMKKRKINRMLRISSLISNFLNFGRTAEVDKILQWPGACNENGILHILIRFRHEGLILKHLAITKVEISSSEFSEAFGKGFYHICVKMLRSKEPRSVLVKEKYQSDLINLLNSGDTCLQAINMLGFINHRDWKTDLTKTLCTSLDEFISTTDELAACSSPLLYCVLVVEFLQNMSLNSVQNKHRCLECADLYISQAFHLQEMIKDDEVLKYQLLETDCRGRSTLSIISENNTLKLLEGLSVGMIIRNIWKGDMTLDIWDCSSLVQVLSGRDEFLVPVKRDRGAFSFQFSMWVDACSSRYFAGSFYIVGLLIVYNLLIILATSQKNFLDLEGYKNTDALLRISQSIIIAMMCDLFCHYMFSMKTKRPFKMDALRIADVIIFGMMLLILAGLDKDMGPGKNYPSADPQVFNGLVHSILNLLIWVRFLLILITTKSLGPFLYMIYCILQKMFSFYFLFACFTIWFAAVFTALFSESDPSEYETFFISFRTLYASALGGFSFANFVQMQVLGCLLLGLYLIIVNIILLNLFIALFTTIYEVIRDQIESTYRSMLIVNYDKWKWDNTYGYFIIIPCPMSVITILIAPFLLYFKNPKLNLKVAKVLYALFVGSLQFVAFLVISVVFLPIAYIVGMSYYPEAQLQSNLTVDAEYKMALTKYSLKKLAFWIFCGPFMLVYYIFRDCVSFWQIMFTDHQTEETMHPFITRENIRALIEAVNKLTQPELTVGELAQIWSYTHSLLTALQEKTEDIEAAQDYLSNFCLSMKSKLIDITKLRKLLNSIEKKDLKRFNNIRIPYVQKAISVFRNLIGGVEIEGIVLPKKFGTPGGSVDTANMRNANKIIQDMNAQIAYFEDILGKVVGRNKDLDLI